MERSSGRLSSAELSRSIIDALGVEQDYACIVAGLVIWRYLEGVSAKDSTHNINLKLVDANLQASLKVIQTLKSLPKITPSKAKELVEAFVRVMERLSVIQIRIEDIEWKSETTKTGYKKKKPNLKPSKRSKKRK